MANQSTKCGINDSLSYAFPAVYGHMYSNYYLATIPAITLTKLVRLDDKGSTLQRSQRLINIARSKRFAKYLENAIRYSGFYTMPPVIGVLDTPELSKQPEFYSVNDLLADKGADSLGYDFNQNGQLVISMDSTMSLFDGQHRTYGWSLIIEVAAMLSKKENDSQLLERLRGVSLPVMLYKDLTLAERQMGFSDINNNLVKPATSISIAYDKRDPISQLAVELSMELTCFKNMVEFEKNTVPKKSNKYFSLKTIRDATQRLLGRTNRDMTPVTEQQKEFVKAFWIAASRATGWGALEFNEGDAQTYREEYINTYAVFTNALGVFGRGLTEQGIELDDVKWNTLQRLSYRHGGASFKDRAFDGKTGNMNPTTCGINLTAIKLLNTVSCPLSLELRDLENKHFPKK